MNGIIWLARLTVGAGIFALTDATPAVGQGLDKYARPLIVEVRSADSARAAQVEIVAVGGFLASVGVLDPQPGTVAMTNGRGRVATPALIEFAEAAGWVTLTADGDGAAIELLIRAGNSAETQRLARGRAIRIESDAEGRIRVGVSGR